MNYYLLLGVALIISGVAEYFSIVGLITIFAAAPISVAIMGVALAIGKLTATAWLKINWHRCSIFYKLYLIPAVSVLMLLTSIGCFGFLSKAHMDQGITSGDVQAKLSLYDEKIKTQRDNIEVARKALQQMDAQVDARLSRGDSENGAERAVQIRRQQAGERAKLQKEIGEAQKEIAKLNEERAPIAAENRKVEAEVGPIKYIAALIYGDNTDQNMLEAAVRWVIILLVVVFDPLAIALVLAANASKEWDNEEVEHTPIYVADVGEKPTPEEISEYEQDDGPLTENQIDQIKDSVTRFVDHGEHPKDRDESVEKEATFEIQLPEPDPIKRVKEKSIMEEHPYLAKNFVNFTNLKPMVHEPVEEIVPVEMPVPTADSMDRPGDYLINDGEIITEGVTKEPSIKQVENNDDYVIVEGKHMHRDAAKSLRPDLFMIKPDSGNETSSKFGIQFPPIANKGDTFVRVDVLPNRVFKFDGTRWIEINKETSDAYLHNEEYIKHLVTMIESGQYDIDLLSDNEKFEIEQYLSTQK